MRHFITIVMLFIGFGLTGCNTVKGTVEGVGKDVQAVTGGGSKSSTQNQNQTTQTKSTKTTTTQTSSSY